MPNTSNYEFPDYKNSSGHVAGPLAGVRVVEFGHFMAGPLASMILADMGAEVIKIEAPGRGDEFRYYPPVHPNISDQSASFIWCNRNKKSIAVNLKDPEGRTAVREIVKSSDVLLENFSANVMKSFGLDYESCKAINDRLIYCYISAYGREGEFADRLGFDPVIQAESGFLSMNGDADRHGVRSASPVMDIGTAMMAANAVIAALYARGSTGQGQAIEVALFDLGIMMTGHAAMQHLIRGSGPARTGNNSLDVCPSGVFLCKDGSFYLNCGNDRMFNRLMTQVINRQDLADDPILSKSAGRLTRRQELLSVLSQEFLREPWAYWEPRMRAANMPCGQVRELGDALRSPESKARNLVTLIEQSKAGKVPNIASPIRFSGTPMVDPVAAPSIGEHTRSILKSLKYSDEKIETLLEAGTVQAMQS